MSAAVGEPIGHQQAKGAQAAGDEVGRVGPALQGLARRLATDGSQGRGEHHAVTTHQDRLAWFGKQFGKCRPEFA
ncbi:Uncharacterised protein [Mycobacterium tuberculosis]|uniref:Uncharacterized protein n=1 Tax=Mycobacterium tuberculosis TaxID=1773 RepID=A0A0T9EXD3_MYCTX|nr:Uncharacterised protein [Mycobacterium tuberculosis]CKU24498.1 Uncharacterised protein [Mycobacterium tuberculosis]COW34187.1 Uncharacterised protein [Mycobacterium tuberculosis]COW92714.1 Uncharacterised protein [Mycobacterium tuberculosis]COX28778.1 Uncharacterised protein [Mycobacterium tuberculosis]